MAAPILRLAGVQRRFRQGGVTLEILKGVELELAGGSIGAIVGQSGSGKSTLLHIAGLLERPDAGTVAIDGRDVARAGDDERTRLRLERIGFVYQFHHLLADFTAEENVALPQLLAGRRLAEARAGARELLERVGLAGRLDHRPGRLSGGEQQRVALARALANGPGLLLADEPTGNLDPATAEEVFALLLDTIRAQGMACLIATHDHALAARMDQVWRLEGGRLRAEASPRAAEPAMLS
jgi:lipoprotein-releasing system ATP-binding protein